MTIDELDFKQLLSTRFIKLLDSKRGIATKLAEAIGKKGSFFSEIKRGKSVNSMHLKAIEIVFGPKKMLELMATDSNSHKELPPNHIVVGKFQQKNIAWSINHKLLRLETLNPEELQEVKDFIQFKIGKYEERKGDDRRTSDQPHNGLDRRNGFDRRHFNTRR